MAKSAGGGSTLLGVLILLGLGWVAVTSYPLVAVGGAAVIGIAVVWLVGRRQPSPGPALRRRTSAPPRRRVRAGSIEPAPLDPTWPVLPPEPQYLATTRPNDEAAWASTACPTCGAEIAPLPKRQRRCKACGTLALVRLTEDGRRQLVTEDRAAELDRDDAERRSAAYRAAERARIDAIAAAGVLVDPDGFEVEVVGESHRHEALAAIKAALGSLEDREISTVARLVREPTNPYDRNAVRVEIHGQHVGYLSREDAEEAQPYLLALEARSTTAYVLATLVGGRPDESGRLAPIGVVLEDVPSGLVGLQPGPAS